MLLVTFVMCGNFQLNSGLNAKPFVPAQVFVGKVSRSSLAKKFNDSARVDVTW